MALLHPQCAHISPKVLPPVAMESEPTEIAVGGDTSIRWTTEWLYDYAVLVALVVARVVVSQTAGTWLGWTVTPGDPTYNKPQVGDLIPSWGNALLSIEGPALLMPLVLIAMIATIRRREAVYAPLFVMDVHNAWLGLLTAYLSTSCVTAALKAALGQPKPSFFAAIAAGGGDDARHSFPSGHASVAAMGYTYLAWYVAGHCGVWRPRGTGQPTPLVWFLVIGAIVAAPIIVAVTRVRDYSHFPLDATVGLLIGGVISSFTYRFHWRWPWQAGADLPLTYSRK